MSFSARYAPWALIAGASEGTGRAFARKLAADGLPSVLVARRQSGLDAVAAEIRAENGVECVTATVDLAAPDASAKLIAAAGDRQIGLFIYNAGADSNGADFLERDIAAWQDLVQRNVTTMMQATHHFAGAMRARGQGGLLLVNSGACYGGAGHMATYSASKAFTLCFAEGLWSELKPHGIDVLTLVMGMTDTPALRALLTERGLPLPPNAASADEVAAIGLARLPHGPIHNWGADDDAVGFAPNSPAQRRARIQMIDAATKRVFGERNS
jgi:uncharacterized protein